MIEIPENLDEWSRGFLIDLIDADYDENLKVEFKSKINFETKKIPITSCAFANTFGGFIVIGINNDRAQTITSDERFVGIEGSDDLKSNIENQIRRVNPPLSTNDYEFRESNIKLPNGKVIVILKIKESENKPHQFEDKFWKRILNKNAVMTLDEIKEVILTSRRSKRFAAMLQREGEAIKDILEGVMLMIDHKDLPEGLSYVKHLKNDAFKHFYFNQAEFYDYKIHNAAHMITSEIDRLIKNENVMDPNKSDPDYDDDLNLIKINTEIILESLKTIEDELGLELTQETQKSGFKSKAEEKIKKDISNAMKKAPEKESKKKIAQN